MYKLIFNKNNFTFNNLKNKLSIGHKHLDTILDISNKCSCIYCSYTTREECFQISKIPTKYNPEDVCTG